MSMEAIKHVRVIRDEPPFDWEATGEWPNTAVGDDETPFPWSVLQALGFSVGMILFALGLFIAVTVPAGRPWHGLIGLAIAAGGAGLTIVALGNVHAEQRRSLR